MATLVLGFLFIHQEAGHIPWLKPNLWRTCSHDRMSIDYNHFPVEQCQPSLLHLIMRMGLLMWSQYKQKENRDRGLGKLYHPCVWLTGNL